MEIYVAKNNEKTGPFTIEQINANIQAGLFKTDDLCWHDGIPNWMPISALIPATKAEQISPVPAIPAGPVQSAKKEGSWIVFGQKKWNIFELILLYIVTAIFCPAGALLAIVALFSPAKKIQAIILLCFSIFLFFLYSFLFSR